ncbi:MAG TPA: DNA repair protein RecN [Candidatus Baltobacteraceae bacterium]|nr:DNA repair protein RecN [Candidatus Baltobacteraceae bacterium]
MLARLEIENYGLIDRAQIAFAEGATMFTGETGSGKTMILGALAFALGARASAEIVRRGAAKATVTLAFEPDAALSELLAGAGFELDAGEEATIVREMTEGGKSNVRVNGRASTASSVRDFAHRIGEIIGQHEAQRLLAPAYHLELLDRFAGTAAEQARQAVAVSYAQAAQCERDLAALQGDEEKARARYDDARFARDEIENTAPAPGEDAHLGERRRYLDNVERIAGALRAAHEALTGDDGSANGAFGIASVALDGIAEISADLREMASQAAALQSESTELAVRISREIDATEFNSDELESINARLDLLDRLKRKYGGTLERVLDHLERSRAIASDYESRGERSAEMHAAAIQARERLASEAAVLTRLRTAAAKDLARAVRDELKDLALLSARFEVAIVRLERVGPDGAESAEFTFAANTGEPLRPLSRVASGGELSRVLLALVVALAAVRERNALVFDEIDTGIGGTTATAVGARLGRLARAGQIVCVTHLAQLAAWADRHYLLEKRETASETTIAVREISDDAQRAAELARMLSGESHDVALEHARTLLRQTARVGT